VILDTNALSAFADGDLALRPSVERAAEISVPVIVLGEYRYGIRHSRYRTRYEQWLIEQLPHWRVLTVDTATAEAYADVRSELKRTGHPIPSNDLWIAALVRQHRQPLLSRDRHFDFVSRLKRVGW
jgi:predicted nucleic acid-binding protein